MLHIALNFFPQDDYELEIEFLFYLMMRKITLNSIPLCFWFYSQVPLFRGNIFRVF